jgi:hypothetical protein
MTLAWITAPHYSMLWSYAVIAYSLMGYSAATLPLSLFDEGQLCVLGLLRPQYDDGHDLHDVYFVAGSILLFLCQSLATSLS